MRKLICYLTCMCALTSCAIYKQRFDCKPEIGVPCTSVTDLEQMVVETDCGPDLFIDDSTKRACARREPMRIWIRDSSCRKGGYFIEAR